MTSTEAFPHRIRLENLSSGGVAAAVIAVHQMGEPGVGVVRAITPAIGRNTEHIILVQG